MSKGVELLGKLGRFELRKDGELIAEALKCGRKLVLANTKLTISINAALTTRDPDLIDISVTLDTIA